MTRAPFPVFFHGKFFHGKRTENGFASDPADNSGRINAGKAAGGIDEDIAESRASAGNEGLMPFIQTGKAHAEKSGGEHKPPAAEPVNVERECDCDCQQKVFRDMGGFSYIMLQNIRVMKDLLRSPSLIKNLIA